MHPFNFRRSFLLLEYMKRGGKVKIDGRTWVWLNKEVVRETDTETWVIDGLATEGRRYGPGEDWNDPTAGKPHYMGQRDMSLMYWLELVDSIPADEMKALYRELQEMVKSEQGRD